MDSSEKLKLLKLFVELIDMHVDGTNAAKLEIFLRKATLITYVLLPHQDSFFVQYLRTRLYGAAYREIVECENASNIINTLQQMLIRRKQLEQAVQYGNQYAA